MTHDHETTILLNEMPHTTANNSFLKFRIVIIGDRFQAVHQLRELAFLPFNLLFNHVIQRFTAVSGKEASRVLTPHTRENTLCNLFCFVAAKPGMEPRLPLTWATTLF